MHTAIFLIFSPRHTHRVSNQLCAIAQLMEENQLNSVENKIRFWEQEGLVGSDWVSQKIHVLTDPILKLKLERTVQLWDIIGQFVLLCCEWSINSDNGRVFIQLFTMVNRSTVVTLLAAWGKYRRIMAIWKLCNYNLYGLSICITKQKESF